MTLTTVVGSSGSGKTTFLNDVHSSNKCIYIRQYHTMRPYIPVSKIPNFDPTRLPFWDIYVKEEKAETIKVGGTMAGEFTAGLSGGQRKLLLFELICQRTADESELLITLDEPFAGVTDDFVPFIVDRLNEMRQKHNIVLVTNDHVDTLTDLADNTITVSALDRTVVKVNEMEGVGRQRAIFALSIGDDYSSKANDNDFRFFWDVEVFSNQALLGIALFGIFCFGLFIPTFWDTNQDQAALVLVARGIIGYFTLNPYLLSLVDWRNAMEEEAEALLHSSKELNRALKATLTLCMMLTIAVVEYGVVNAVVDGFSEVKFLFAMFFDDASMTLSFICLGVYTNLAFQKVQILGSLPFLLMIFFSTTFSPGAGVEGLKELRYLFARFYFWCMVPGIQDDMEGCPGEDLTILYLFLSSLVTVSIFFVYLAFKHCKAKGKAFEQMQLKESLMDDDFYALQKKLYGEKALKRLNHLNDSAHSKNSATQSRVSKESSPA